MVVEIRSKIRKTEEEEVFWTRRMTCFTRFDVHAYVRMSKSTVVALSRKPHRLSEYESLRVRTVVYSNHCYDYHY